jgi:hypothetical protein
MHIDHKAVMLYIECAFNAISATLILQQECV